MLTEYREHATRPFLTFSKTNPIPTDRSANHVIGPQIRFRILPGYYRDSGQGITDDLGRIAI